MDAFSSDPDYRRGLAAAGTTVFAWSFTGIFVRLLPALCPFFLTGTRLLIAFSTVTPVLLVSRAKRRSLARVLLTKRTWGLASSLVAYYVLAVSAYQYAPVAEVSVLGATGPLFVLGFKYLRRSEVKRHEAFGALAALVGVLVIFLPNLLNQHGAGATRLRGHALALSCAFAAAVYAWQYRTAAKESEEEIDPPAVSAVAFGFGTLVSFTLSPALWTASPESLLKGPTLLAFLALGIISTAVPSVTYAIASQKLPVVVATTSQLLIPVFSTVLAAALLRELPSPWLVPGGALVLLGMASLSGVLKLRFLRAD